MTLICFVRFTASTTAKSSILATAWDISHTKCAYTTWVMDTIFERRTTVTVNSLHKHRSIQLVIMFQHEDDVFVPRIVYRATTCPWRSHTRDLPCYNHSLSQSTRSAEICSQSKRSAKQNSYHGGPTEVCVWWKNIHLTSLSWLMNNDAHEKVKNAQ